MAAGLSEGCEHQEPLVRVAESHCQDSGTEALLDQAPRGAAPVAPTWLGRLVRRLGGRCCGAGRRGSFVQGPDSGEPTLDASACVLGPGAAEPANPEQGSNPAEPASVLLDLAGSDATVESLYEFGEKLGEGSFGKVYACSIRGEEGRNRSGPNLCVKCVPLTGRRSERKLSDEEEVEFLRRVGSLDHPNIVRYHRLVRTDEAFYVVMTRCEGPDLLDHVEGQLLPYEKVRVLGQQILSAIAAVHAVGLMHRDIKPQNYRFGDAAATVLQLLDFGAAKVSGPEPAPHSVTGTLLYAAPEVFDGCYGCRCDLWSAGVILFLLVAGHLPFETSDVTILRSLHHDPVLTGDSLLRGPRWRTAPPGAKDLARGLLQVEPANRLTALAASSHHWLTHGGDPEPAEEHEAPVGDPPTATLTRSNSSSVALTDLKRSYFVWNLAACDSDSDDGVGGGGGQGQGEPGHRDAARGAPQAEAAD